MDLWEELWGKWCQEIRLLDAEITHGIEKRQPTFDQIKYYVSIPDADGYASFKPPNVFDFEDPTSFFNTDVMARLERQSTRHHWKG